jgi:hypothetical protein
VGKREARGKSFGLKSTSFENLSAADIIADGPARI